MSSNIKQTSFSYGVEVNTKNGAFRRYINGYCNLLFQSKQMTGPEAKYKGNFTIGNIYTDLFSSNYNQNMGSTVNIGKVPGNNCLYTLEKSDSETIFIPLISDSILFFAELMKDGTVRYHGEKKLQTIYKIFKTSNEQEKKRYVFYKGFILNRWSKLDNSYILYNDKINALIEIPIESRQRGAIQVNSIIGKRPSIISINSSLPDNGFKVNNARDESSGFSISEKMKNQTKNMTEVKNLENVDGTPLVQTHNEKKAEITIERMNALAEKDFQDSAQVTPKEELTNEFDELQNEIDRLTENID